MKLIKLVFILCAGAVLAGCISAQSYVDPAYKKATYESVTRPQTPIPVKVAVEFQRNGKPLSAVDKELRGHIERTLRTSGVFEPVAQAPATIRITANNIADLEAAKSKGFKTGFTFGGAGSMIDDNYEIACSYSAPNAKHDARYQHAIHSAIGHTKERPVGLTPTTPVDAFGRVIEDVTLNCIKDLQDAKVLNL